MGTQQDKTESSQLAWRNKILSRLEDLENRINEQEQENQRRINQLIQVNRNILSILDCHDDLFRKYYPSHGILNRLEESMSWKEQSE